MQITPRKVYQYDDKIMLHIGELYFTKKPMVLWTILGSCVGIVFYSRRKQLGAISHAQMPNPNFDSCRCIDHCPIKCDMAVSDSNAGKFVTSSFKFMLERFSRTGILKDEIEVKLFGGASVLGKNHGRKTVGQQNIETATELIKANNLKLLGENTGGNIGRTIFFLSDTGIVYHRYHKKSNSALF